MDFYDLTATHFDTMKQRLAKAAAKISASALPPTLGRVVPQDDDLTLGSGRALKLAVLFLDICGFSQRASGTPDAQAKLLPALDLLFSELVRIVEEYGGTVEKNTGDGLMAYFEAAEDTPAVHRAVSCALTLQFANTHVISSAIRNLGLSHLNSESESIQAGSRLHGWGLLRDSFRTSQ